MTSPVPKPVWIIPPPTSYDVVGEIVCETCLRHHEGVARRRDPWTPVVYRDLTDCPENEDFDRTPLKPAPPAAPTPRPAPTLRAAPAPAPKPHFELNPPPPPDWGTGPPPPRGR